MSEAVVEAGAVDGSLDPGGEFIVQAMGDLGAAASTAMAVLGDRLGLYAAMAAAGPVTPSELAARAGFAERYVREWLCSQAAAGWVLYDDDSEQFELPVDRAAVLADETSPMFMGPSIQMVHALYRSIDRLAEAFASGDGIGWGEHHADLHEGVARFGRAMFSAMLPTWVEASGAATRLRSGGRILDIACGYGATTVTLATSFPDAHVDGFDADGPSIETAQQAVDAAGVSDRVSLLVRPAGGDDTEAAYDLVLLCDCLHDMGDPVAAATAARRALAPGGVVLIIEPTSSDRLAENFNPVGRFLYAVSTSFCMPSALSQPGGWALGNQSGPASIIDICHRAGLATVEPVETTPINMVFAARP